MKYLPLFLLLVLVSACSIEDRIERREDRIIGRWQLDRATEQNFGAVFWDNVTSDFRGDEITFFADYSLTYEADDGQFYDGAWRIRAVRVDAGDETDTDYFLDAEFYDNNFDQAFTWIAEIERLDRSRLKILVSEPWGLLRLRWDSF